MKQVSCLIISIIFLLGLSSCSSHRKDNKPKDTSSLNSTDKIIEGPLDTYDCAASVSMEKLEFNSSDKNFTFKGEVIPKDDGPDFEKIIHSFAEQKENGNLFPGSSTEIELRFTDSIPQAITWYEIYVRNGGIDYPGLSIPHPVNEIGAKTILPIGINMAMALDSSIHTKLAHKSIRIVCEYDDRTVEYTVFFGSLYIEGDRPYAYSQSPY